MARSVWSGTFELVLLLFLRYRSDIIADRTINAPSSGNTGDAWKSAALAVGASEATVSVLSPLPCCNTLTPAVVLQLQDNGFVSGGVGAVASAAPTSDTSGSSGSGASRLAVSGALVGAAGLAAAMLFA